MVIFCEECGEKYILEPDKVKGAELIFICRICNDIIRVPIQETQEKQRVTAKGKKKLYWSK
jgi:RNase P subunit RPR2